MVSSPVKDGSSLLDLIFLCIGPTPEAVSSSIKSVNYDVLPGDLPIPSFAGFANLARATCDLLKLAKAF
jgi:hypothetical protein